ncbi:EamA family transporter [Rhodococcus spelaei]|uniref:EamA family transporter n=1 Tax=Rhodococcus spelaei TaxID=2546320 RepID=A0A541BRE2_9NOCA|nr:EamA family transporter [Rhodococcus spelaei]TQF74907.1 EamA family transporter [Rhodococcus spelaei]
MTNRDRLLGLTVALLWGLNFLAIRIGLDHFPPFFFAALRFLVIAIPVVLFVPRPNVPIRWLLLYGVGFGVLQFAFLFWAMNTGMPTGLASLVLQSSAPFTVLLGAALLGERVSRRQALGILVAMAGMATIGWDRLHTAGNASTALLPVLLTLLGGLGWALGNIGSRQARPDNPMRLTLWMAVIPPLPMLVVSAVVEGPTAGVHALRDSLSVNGWPALAALAYIAVLATVVGSGLWTYLMSRHPAGVVAPFSLLVPIVGIAAAWLVLGERPSALSLVGAAVVVVGCLGGMARATVSTAPRPTPPIAAVTLPTPVAARP